MEAVLGFLDCLWIDPESCCIRNLEDITKFLKRRYAAMAMDQSVEWPRMPYFFDLYR